MDQEKEKTKKKTSTKKKSSTTSTLKKKTTTPKKTTAKKTTTKKVEDVIMPYVDELSTVIEDPIPYHDELSTVVEEKKDEDITPVELVEEVKDAITTPVKDLVNGDFRKKPSNWIYAIVGIFFIFMIVVCVYSYFHPKTGIRNGKFIYLGESSFVEISDRYLEVHSRKELSRYFPNASYREIDFDQYDYLILPIRYDPCSESDFEPVDFKMIDGAIHVQFNYNASCGGCAPEELYYLLEIEKGLRYSDVEIDYHPINDPNCNSMVAYKPILYFYPEKETNLSVVLGHEEFLTTTYPTYQHRWEVTAYPDGTLKDSAGREYYGLFWEGNHHYASMKDDGFVVSGEEVQSFLEDKLRVLGLTDREANEFIIYWLPQLENHPYVYIRFETIDEINQYMPLEVQPVPDSIIRIQMDYKVLEEKVDVKEQWLETPVRRGFTVVEWGGSIIKD